MRSFALNITQMRVAAGLCTDPLGELTSLPQTPGFRREGSGGTGKGEGRKGGREKGERKGGEKEGMGGGRYPFLSDFLATPCITTTL